MNPKEVKARRAVLRAINICIWLLRKTGRPKIADTLAPLLNTAVRELFDTNDREIPVEKLKELER